MSVTPGDFEREEPREELVIGLLVILLGRWRRRDRSGHREMRISLAERRSSSRTKYETDGCSDNKR